MGELWIRVYCVKICTNILWHPANHNLLGVLNKLRSNGVGRVGFSADWMYVSGY